MNDPAAPYARRTPRQRRQLANRYDREAAETIAAYQERKTAEARAMHVRNALGDVNLFTQIAFAQSLHSRRLTPEELRTAQGILSDAWKTLKKYGADVVTVLT